MLEVAAVADASVAAVEVTSVAVVVEVVASPVVPLLLAVALAVALSSAGSEVHARRRAAAVTIDGRSERSMSLRYAILAAGRRRPAER